MEYILIGGIVEMVRVEFVCVGIVYVVGFEYFVLGYDLVDR